MTHRLAFLDSWASAPERGSGTAVAVSGLAAGLTALGCRVTTVRPPIRDDCRDSGGGPPRLSSRLRFNLGLSRFDPAPYDAVVGFDLDGVFFRPGPGVLYAVSLKGVAADERRFERGLPRLTLTLSAALEARNARRASRVLVTSEHSRKVAVAAYGLDPGRVAVVPEGIDLHAWQGVGSEAAGGRREEGSPEGRPPVVLSVAHQYRRKDTPSLLEAFARLARRYPEARLRVVGGGPELPRLRAAARELGLGDRIAFLGEVADDQAVRREYLGADVFCLPSLQEGFGIAFLEAMAASLPVVAARAAATPEVVPDGEAGILVPPRDPAALAAALGRLLEDARLRRRLGEAGRRRVERYEWQVVAEGFLEALGLGA